MSTVKTNNVQIGQSVTATNNFTWYQPATPDGTVRLGNGNSGSVTDLVTLTSAGNLGIGTASPVGKSDVVSNAYAAFVARASTSGVGQSVDALKALDSAASQFANAKYTALSHGWYNQSLARQLYLDSSGNLGLGVTPRASVVKSFEVGDYTGLTDGPGGGGGYGLLGNAYEYSGNAYKYGNSYYATMYRTYAGQHQWYTAPSGTAGNVISFTQAMTLDASGRLCVGATTPITNHFSSITTYANGGTYYGICIKNISASTTNAIDFLNSSEVTVGRIEINSSGTTYVTSSDQRLKTNITPAGSAIQSILNFPVDQFDWIESGEHQDFGGVAQKAINFIPEMVSVPADLDEMWGIDWSKAVPRLIKTIQELSAELNLLKQKVNA